MRKYRKWVMTLGIIAVTPGLAMAGPLSFLKDKSETASTANRGARKTNQQVAEEVARALREAGLTGYDIEIEYKGGIVSLTGKVGTAEQKELATKLISRIPEVKSVANRLTPIQQAQSQVQQVSFDTAAGAPQGQIEQASVAPSQAPPAEAFAPAAPAAPVQPTAAAEAQADYATGNNQQVAEQIAAALSPALSGYNVEIRYNNGTAFLSGAVANLEQRETAAQLASRVPGVQSVRNNLVCPGAPQPNARQAAYAAQQQQLAMAAYQNGGVGPEGGVPPGAVPPGPMPGAYGGPMGAQPVLNNPSLPQYAWPSYASYPNYAQVTYPQQYSASAWPYIGPFYPYPQVPLGWRQVQLEWDDGMWNLNFRPRTDKWWWFLHPKNW